MANLDLQKNYSLRLRRDEKPTAGELIYSKDCWSSYLLNISNGTGRIASISSGKVNSTIEGAKQRFNFMIDNSWVINEIKSGIQTCYSLKTEILAHIDEPITLRKDNKAPVLWASCFRLKRGVGDTGGRFSMIQGGWSRPIPVKEAVDKESYEILLQDRDTTNRMLCYYNENGYTIPQGFIYKGIVNDLYKEYDSPDKVNLFDNYESALADLKRRVFSEFDRLENHYIDTLKEVESMKYPVGNLKPSKILNLTID